MKRDEEKVSPTEQWLKRTEDRGPVSDYKESHPSFGVVGISRRSGRSSLFQSDVVHNHCIALTIKQAERIVSGVQEYVFGRETLVEVEMTESQFAQMITQPNVGDGVACTIRYNEGDHHPKQEWLHPRHGARPECPEPEPFLEKYKAGVQKRAEDSEAALKTAMSMVSDLLEGKTSTSKANLKAVLSNLQTTSRQFSANLPYVVEEMHGKMEERLAKAAVEFECYVSQSLQSRGLASFAEDAPKLRLGGEPNLALPSETE